MSKPTGVSALQARSHVAALDLLLAATALDADTERRARWLRMRLCELLGEHERPFDFVEARIAMILPTEGRRRLADRTRVA